MKRVRAFLFALMCLAPVLPLLGGAPDWENEEVTGINKEPPRASVMPAADKKPGRISPTSPGERQFPLIKGQGEWKI